MSKTAPFQWGRIDPKPVPNWTHSFWPHFLGQINSSFYSAGLKIQPSISKTFKESAPNKEAVLLSFSHFKAEEILHMRKTDDPVL